MASIAVFKLNQTPQYLTSVNTPDYEGDPDVIVNPDVSGVEGVPLKYWKRDGDTIAEMSQAEKAAILATELEARKALANNFGVQEMKTVLTALIKVINIRLPVGSKITAQEMIDALKAEII